jgi:voltage-gated potassium channel Kch
MLAVLVLGTVGFTLAEKLPIYDAIYFSIVTVTTVGYGDISPHTALGKVLAIFLILGGVGTFMGVVANFTEMLLSRREKAARDLKLYMVEDRVVRRTHGQGRLEPGGVQPSAGAPGGL